MNDMTMPFVQRTLPPRNAMEAFYLHRQAEEMRRVGYHIEVPDVVEPLGFKTRQATANDEPFTPTDNVPVFSISQPDEPRPVELDLQDAVKSQMPKTGTTQQSSDIKLSDETASEHVSIWRKLKDDVYKFAEAVRDAVINNHEFAVALGDVFSKAGIALPVRTPPASIIELPKTAPRLWADRDPGTKPTDFVRTVYARWIEAGVLSTVALKKLDWDLYQRYFTRIGRYPGEAITFAEGNSYGKLDDAEAGRRHREGVKNSKAKAKAKAKASLGAGQFVARPL